MERLIQDGYECLNAVEGSRALLGLTGSETRPTQLFLGFGGQVLADALDGVALAVVEGEEFESVAQALAVADDGADFDGIGRKGQRNFKSNDFAGFEASGESGADAVLSHFGGASPAGAEFSGLKHLDLQADVDGEAGKAASEGSLLAGARRAPACRFPSSAAAAAALAFFSLLMTHDSYRTHVSAACAGLIAVQQVSGLER